MPMPKKRVYVESSVISYLTARPSNDILKLAKQRQTQIWWEQRHKWELCVSQAVVREMRDGDRLGIGSAMGAAKQQVQSTIR